MKLHVFVIICFCVCFPTIHCYIRIHTVLAFILMYLLYLYEFVCVLTRFMFRLSCNVYVTNGPIFSLLKVLSRVLP